MKEKKREPKLKKIFNDCRIAALAAEKNAGKTNNLVHLIIDFRKYDQKTAIYIYGIPAKVSDFLIKNYNCKEVSTLKQLRKKENSLIILDEIQRLKINDKRYKDVLDDFIDLIYHRNCYVIFATPDPREFNSIIGGKIQKWLLKTIDAEDCVNGSPLKKAILEYTGRYKQGVSIISTPKHILLITGGVIDEQISCDYEKEADTKSEKEHIF